MIVRITWARAVVGALAAVLLALAVGWSGAIDVAASSGHWKVTDWFLHWVMRNSVKTHSALSSPDAASDPTGLVSAAGHYAASCASCHGAPGVRPMPVMQAATPHAPDLKVNARQWTDRQLHWILDHGVKYTGMPAWPARGRSDEIARMVAFVRRLPDMSPDEYRRLTGGMADLAPTARFEACVMCHGADGRGRGQPDVPVLGGQHPGYLLAALKAFHAGARESAVMENAAARLSTSDMEQFAARFAGMAGLARVRADDDSAAGRIVRNGFRQRQLPACAGCHVSGKPYPVLAGQKAAYIAGRLRRWRGDPTQVDARKSAAIMPVIARRIPEGMIEPLARYYAGVGSERD